MRTLKISILLTFWFTILLGVIYPYLIWGIGEIFFHKKTSGTLLTDKNGNIVGSERIGQAFTSDKYFHPRPSAAGDRGYDAANSSGSNWGPTSQKFIDIVKQRTIDYRISNQLSADTPIPSDAVTASGSGLDPHITLENAMLQAARVAHARGMTRDQVMKVIDVFTEGGFFGDKRVNVLLMNLELDKKYSNGLKINHL